MQWSLTKFEPILKCEETLLFLENEWFQVYRKRDDLLGDLYRLIQLISLQLEKLKLLRPVIRLY